MNGTFKVSQQRDCNTVTEVEKGSESKRRRMKKHSIGRHSAPSLTRPRSFTQQASCVSLRLQYGKGGTHKVAIIATIPPAEPAMACIAESLGILLPAL